MYKELALEHFNNAEGLYLNGDISGAITLYKNALRCDPNLTEAALNLSYALVDQGLLDEAIIYLQPTLDNNPDNAGLLHNYANILLKMKRYEEAISCYEKALKNQPQSVVTRFNLAVALHQLNRLEDAKDQYIEILDLDPFHKEALYNLSSLCLNLAKYEDALNYLNRCLKIDPKDPKTLNLIALTFHKAGNYRAAEGCFRRAIQIKPGDYTFHFNFANLLSNQERIEEAIAEYQKTIQLNKDFLEGYIQLGNHLKKKKLYEEAIGVFNQAISINNNSAETYNNIGNIYKELGRYEEAIAFTKRAIEINPQQAGYYFNLGLSNKELFRYTEAIEAYTEAIKLRWDYPEAHWNLALLLLLKEDFKRGWSEYEWRKKLPLYAPYIRTFKEPQWEGEQDLKGKTILIYDEQGFGDAIQFIRYAKMLKDEGAKVVVECLSPLSRLFQYAMGVDQVITRGFPLPPFDFQCSMLSLPMYFKTDLSSIPAETPYIKLPQDIVAQWQERLLDFKDKFKIGISWAGINPPHKSCPINTLSPLFEITNLCIFNLQKGPAQEELNGLSKDINLIDFMNDSKDFADTAAIMKNLDLIITVDTSIAHLAGALGLPVWVMLHYDADWRWLLKRPDSPWYPTMRLFRQPEYGNWKALLQDMALKLKASITQDKN